VPSLLGAVTAVLLTAWLGSRLFSANVGLIGAVVLASTMLLNVQARLATTDAALLACIVAAEAALAAAYRSEPRRDGRLALLFWGALGAGVLIKGPIAPIVCGATVAALVAVERRVGWLSPFRSLGGVGLFLAITLPWLAAIAYVAGGSFFEASIGDELLGKVLVGQQAHGAPPGYHLAAFVFAFWPFSLLAAFALPWTWRNRARPEVRFCLAWIVPTWILFELVVTKLPHYVLPVYPAIALLTAAAVAEGGTETTIGTRPRLTRALLWAWLVVCGLVALSIVAVPIALQGSPSGLAVVAGMIAAATAWTAAALLRAGRHSAATAILAGTAAVFHPLLSGLVLPRIDSLWVSRRVADVVEHSRPCADTTVAAVGYHEPSLVFTLGTATKLVGPRLAAEHLFANPACALALVTRAEEEPFRRIVADSGAMPRDIGRVAGFDYSIGEPVDLGLFAIERRER
jgi:4-amino-4-deoxy-L-arabinose transferase-like glycosyltransferase